MRKLGSIVVGTLELLLLVPFSVLVAVGIVTYAIMDGTSLNREKDEENIFDTVIGKD